MVGRQERSKKESVRALQGRRQGLGESFLQVGGDNGAYRRSGLGEEYNETVYFINLKVVSRISSRFELVVCWFRVFLPVSSTFCCGFEYFLPLRGHFVVVSWLSRFMFAGRSGAFFQN